MSTYLVTYDLKQPGRNYEPVYDYLKKLNTCHGLESVWLVDSRSDAATIRNDLLRLIDPSDVVLVVELKQHWASTGNYPCIAWLKNSTRTW